MSDGKKPSSQRFRQFRCHDMLWEVFEEMAVDREQPIDDLIDEAMRTYAKKHGYGVPPAAGRYEGIKTPVRVTPRAMDQAPPAAAVAVPGSERGPRAAAPPVGALALTYGGATLIIDKEQFVIGRGPKHSDLSIDDPDVSRRHAAVIRRPNGYYIRDLGSTNGITFKGTRIDHKRIEDGDVFFICSHELRFHHRP